MIVSMISRITARITLRDRNFGQWIDMGKGDVSFIIAQVGAGKYNSRGAVGAVTVDGQWERGRLRSGAWL